MNELIVTHADMRALGYCNRGARAWFAQHQFDWPRFLEEGLPAGDLLATGDQLAHAVVEVASQRTQTGGDDGRQ